ncbi:MAG: hypothetical protein QY321_03020 [Patescibacteria group bacterium]|nr:MAG: hypothetical protein QY321_03020 [Patescibacteria group bacterium]
MSTQIKKALIRKNQTQTEKAEKCYLIYFLDEDDNDYRYFKGQVWALNPLKALLKYLENQYLLIHRSNLEYVRAETKDKKVYLALEKKEDKKGKIEKKSTTLKKKGGDKSPISSISIEEEKREMLKMVGTGLDIWRCCPQCGYKDPAYGSGVKCPNCDYQEGRNDD